MRSWLPGGDKLEETKTDTKKRGKDRHSQLKCSSTQWNNYQTKQNKTVLVFNILTLTGNFLKVLKKEVEGQIPRRIRGRGSYSIPLTKPQHSQAANLSPQLSSLKKFKIISDLASEMMSYIWVKKYTLPNCKSLSSSIQSNKSKSRVIFSKYALQSITWILNQLLKF